MPSSILTSCRQPNGPYNLQDLRHLTVLDATQLSFRLDYDQINDLHWDLHVPMASLAFDQVHERHRGASLSFALVPIVDCDPKSMRRLRSRRSLRCHSGTRTSCTVPFSYCRHWSTMCLALPCSLLRRQRRVNVTGSYMPVNSVDSPPYSCTRTKFAFPFGWSRSRFRR